MNTRASLKRFAIIAVWLVIWQLIALLVNNTILLAGPLEVLGALMGDVVTPAFWASIGFSFVRIVGGFLVAFILGLAVGSLAGRFAALRDFLEPALQFVKSVPIVCIIVLLLLWFGSPLVSAIAVFLVAFPAIYFAVLQALRERKQSLNNMLALFRVKTWRRILAYNWPSILPFLISTSRVAVGMSWKSGVAAELIGLPLGSIGENIYHAKITLSSAELFSWTLVIVVLSLLCEKVFLVLLKKSETWAWRLALPRFKPVEHADEQCVEEEPGAVRQNAAQAGDSFCGPNSSQASGSADPPEHSKPAVRFESVSVSFGEQQVLSGLTLELLKGERYALRGISGSGKTTLLGVIEGTVAPFAGTVDIAGRLSAMFQDSRLFERYSALDNVQLIAGSSVRYEHIESVLFDLLTDEDALHKPVSELSGGMRRRVELARALVYPSDILLLDEPFAGLDEASKIQAQSVLLRELNGRTLVIATHDNEDEQALSLTPLSLM